MKRIFVVALLFSVAQPCISSTSITTLGDIDCGSWLDHRAHPDGFAALNDEAYLNGILTGINATATQGGFITDPLSKLKNGNQAWFWVDNYCKSHPLDTISNAGVMLINQLEK